MVSVFYKINNHVLNTSNNKKCMINSIIRDNLYPTLYSVIYYDNSFGFADSTELELVIYRKHII